MVEKELAELFLNKKIVFKWQSDNRVFESTGSLKKVTDSSIVIDFFGKLQVYSLNSIIVIREFEEKRGFKNEKI